MNAIIQSLSAAVQSRAVDESPANPSFARAVDRLESRDIIQRFRDGNGQRFIALTPRARRLRKEDLIREMIES